MFWIVAAGIVYGNVLRWYPFPAGRWADLTSLQSNRTGIIVNVAIYWSILEGYCLYLALQAPFRAT